MTERAPAASLVSSTPGGDSPRNQGTFTCEENAGMSEPLKIKPDVRTNYYLNGDCPNCGRHRLELYVDGPEGDERAVGIKCEKCYVGWLLDPAGPGAMFHGDLSENDPLNPFDPHGDDWLKP